MIELPFTYYQIGRFNVNCKELTVDNGKDSIKLPIKVFELLKLFISRKDHSVIASDAIETIWNGNEGVGKRGFPNTIWHLRKTFSDLGAENDEILKTVHKVGYILVVKPTALSEGPKTDNTSVDSKSFSLLKNNKLFASIVGLFLFSVSIYFISDYFINKKSRPELSLEITKHTNYQGIEMHPAVSNDGKYLAFRWVRESTKGHLYIKDLLNEELPLRLLTNTPNEEASPTWSPDDSSIAYIRYDAAGFCQIRVKHLVTNQDELIAEGCIFNANRLSLDWSPNGNLLLYSKKVNDSLALFSYNFKTKLSTQVSFPKNGIRDVASIWSIDSKSIVLIREGYQLAQLISINDLGEETVILDNQTSIIGLAWDHQNNEIYTSFLKNSEHVIYKYNVEQKNWQDVNEIPRPANITINQSTGELFFSRYSSHEFILQRTFDANLVLARVSSSSRDMFGSYSPVNGNIAFISNRSGNWDLWIKSKLDTINITKGMGLPLSPNWSPISEQFIVDLRLTNSERFQVYIGDSTTGSFEPLNLGELNPQNPRWSFDGSAILFISSQNDTTGVFSYDLSTAQVTQLTTQNEKVVVEGGDGYLYVSRDWKNGIWQVNPETKEEKLLIEDLISTDHGSFFWQNNAIYYVSRSATKDIIKKHEINGKTTTINTLPANSIKRYFGISAVDANSYLLTLNANKDADIYSVKVFNPNP